MGKHRFKKHKILLDEALPSRQLFPLTNECFDVKHIKHDLNSGGVSDEILCKFAQAWGRLIVTPNRKDYKVLLKNNKTGIIFISMALKNEDIDKKLCSLLKESSENDLYGKINNITGETGKKQ